MDITLLGHSSFRLKGKTATVITDPFDDSVGFKFPRVMADIVTVSHQHDDHNNTKAVQGNPRIIASPGEYEIGGVSIAGIPTFHDDKKGEERGKNTIFLITLDNLVICHLGDLGHKLSEDQVGEIGAIDILLIPTGGEFTIDASVASEVTSSLEPNVIIPMHYKAEGMSSAFDKLQEAQEFVKEMGIEPARDSKYSVTKDAMPEETQLVILERRS